MNSIGKLTNIIILLLIGIIIYQSCSKELPQSETITETETIWVPIIKHDTLFSPRYDTIISYHYDTIIKHDTIIKFNNIIKEIDTLSILRDYFSKIVYTDTLSFDSLGYVFITDTIYKNRILTRKITKNINLPTTYKTTTITLNPREFYMGVGIGTNQASGELLLRNKNKQIYGLGLGVDNNLNPFIVGRIYWKL